MSKLNVDTSKWVKGKDFPEWMDEIGTSIISQGYLLPEENVFKAFNRVSKAASRRLKRKDLQPFFAEAMEKNWLCLASPVLSNLGTERGMPISCFGIDTDDSIGASRKDIYSCFHQCPFYESKNGDGHH